MWTIVTTAASVGFWVIKNPVLSAAGYLVYRTGIVHQMAPTVGQMAGEKAADMYNSYKIRKSDKQLSKELLYRLAEQEGRRRLEMDD